MLRRASIAKLCDLVEHLALALASLQVCVASLNVVELEALVHRDLQLALLQPAKDVVGALQQLGAGDCVVVELGAGQVRRLADELQGREGRDGSGGVAEADENSTAGLCLD